ncbi:MAG: aldehyde dehydrogenase family protein [Patescibacteria group bacterium]
MINGKNYINGEFVESISGEKFESRNPAHFDEILGTFPKSNVKDVNMAVDAAKKAFSAWKKLGMVKRAEIIGKVAQFIQNEEKMLAELVCKESGKQINESYADVIEGRHMVEYNFAVGHYGQSGRILDDEIALKRCYEKIEPRGVVVAISPWNFPYAIPWWLCGLSLIYGNTVILKPSSETPACAFAIAKQLHKAGIPRGVFQVLTGNGSDCGMELVKHPDVNVVLLTGSYETGLEIKRETALHYNKFCSIETGGKSAVIVLKDAKIEMALAAILTSAFKTAGQRCVTGGRAIVERPVYMEFIDKFSKLAKKIKFGEPMDENMFYGAMINQLGKEQGIIFNDLARKENFTVLVDRGQEQPTKNGFWLGPFVYTGEWRSNSYVLTHEAFSPHLAIIPADNVDDAIRIYNDTEFGLAGSVITENYRLAQRVMEEMECGIAYHNLPCIGAGVRLPFGGVKKSGNLISSASGIVPAITHKKSITINLDDKIVMAQGLSIDV